MSPQLSLGPLQAHDCRRLAKVQYLVGVDEAGRGALAGPVTAGACVLSTGFFENAEAIRDSRSMNDSKQLTAADREAQLSRIEALRAQGWLDFETAHASVDEICKLNILGATKLAMTRALERLADRAAGWSLPTVETEGPLFAGIRPKVCCLVDGRPLGRFRYAHEGLVGGDGRSLAIAIASIAAKVARDQEMTALGDRFPGYGFDAHKGYGTKAHREAIRRLGPTPIHRSLFLRKILA